MPNAANHYATPPTSRFCASYCYLFLTDIDFLLKLACFYFDKQNLEWMPTIKL